jgi:SPP1 family predicted phage head-tail adaptor
MKAIPPGGQAKGRLKAGDLIHHVTLQAPVYTTTPGGSRVVTGWTSGTPRWARVEALTGRELWLAQQVQSDITYKISFRPLAGVDSSWSVLWGSKRYQLAEAPRDPVGDGEHVEVLAILRTS